jgi:hypothetical protein
MNGQDKAINTLSVFQQGVVANVMLNGMAQMTEKVIKQINQLYDINISRNEELFTYVFDNEVLPVAAGLASQATGYVTIEDNVNFIWCAWSAQAWTQEDPTIGLQPFTMQVKFHGTDRYFHTSHPFLAPIHSNFVATGGPMPTVYLPQMTWLPMPYVLTRSSQVSFLVTNLQAGVAIDVRIALHGYRIFSYDSLNMAVRRR